MFFVLAAGVFAALRAFGRDESGNEGRVGAVVGGQSVGMSNTMLQI